MAANRIRQQWSAAQTTGPNLPPQPAPSAQPLPHGFVVCPQIVAAVQPWQLALYRHAYEQAKAAVLIPRYHRLLFSVWN